MSTCAASAARLDEKIVALAGLVAEARTVTVYTGAGISTSAGISDFRGPSSPGPFRVSVFAARTLKRHRPIPGHSIAAEGALLKEQPVGGARRKGGELTPVPK